MEHRFGTDELLLHRRESVFIGGWISSSGRVEPRIMRFRVYLTSHRNAALTWAIVLFVLATSSYQAAWDIAEARHRPATAEI
jgi:hypothetical protein